MNLGTAVQAETMRRQESCIEISLQMVPSRLQISGEFRGHHTLFLGERRGEARLRHSTRFSRYTFHFWKFGKVRILARSPHIRQLGKDGGNVKRFRIFDQGNQAQLCPLFILTQFNPRNLAG